MSTQTLNDRWVRSRVLPFALLFCMIMQGCGFEKTMTFSSPSGRAAVEVWQSRFDNFQRARVDLIVNHRRTNIYSQSREAGIYFVHVYWSTDEAKVGVVATGFAYFNIAADVTTGQALPFDLIRNDVARSIRAEYQVPNNLDPIKWAAENSAHEEFFNRHPEIHVSYR